MKPPRFIGEAIDAFFEQPPALAKKPGCPDGFVWDGKHYQIVEKLKEWHDYRRRGHMRRNMRPEHAATARRRGSWGVGRDYYRVQVVGGRMFELYYDRSPQGVDRQEGGWFLVCELNDEG